MVDYNKIIGQMEEKLQEQPEIEFSNFDSKETVLFVVDMSNGFAREGILSSPRVESIIPEIKKLVKNAKNSGIEVLYFTDAHSEESPEVKRLGKHCLQETLESEIVEELKGYEDIKIEKNSTNGFLADKFQKWLKSNLDINNYIITGCVTDICIYNFASTLRAYLDKHDINRADIYVPQNCVATYDLELHNAKLMDNVFLYSMLNYGIKVIKRFI